MNTTYVGTSTRELERARDQSRRRHPAASARSRRVAARQAPPPRASYYVLAMSVALLVMLGLVMVLSASTVTAIQGGQSSYSFFTKQAIWAVFGVVALVAMYRLPQTVLRRLAGPLLLLALALNVVVLVPGVGVMANGSRAWLSVGPATFQPSELLKLALLVFCADLLARRADRMAETRITLRPVIVLLLVSSGLLLAQSDLGGAIVVAGIALAVLFVAGAPLVPFSFVAGGFAAAGVLFVVSEPYRRERWLAFLDLAAHKQDAGYQVWQSLIGIASGGATGVGLGASRAKWGYLPESHTDFIFAIVAEEMGLVGVVAVIGLYLVLLFVGTLAALRCTDRFGQLLAGGITAWIALQATINIGGVVGVMPLTGLTLPFMSYGRSSLLVMMMAAGLLLNVARRPA